MKMVNAAKILSDQRKYFHTGATLSYEFRMEKLKQLKIMLKKYESELFQALKLDLNKSKHEAWTTELGFLHVEIDFAIKHLKQWMNIQRTNQPTTHIGSKSYIHKEPYGNIMIIAPWNYPIQLALAPVVGAIAAGNTVVIKPSEYAVETSKLLKEMIANTFEPKFMTVVQGAIEETEELLRVPFDYIFFTGSSTVGKLIMKKASEHLTPVTLELGGKSPVIVDRHANIKLAAKRIVWGKFTNAGQTCVAPDYLLVHEKVKKQLVRAMKKQVKQFYGKHPLKNKSYIRIVHDRHFQRLKGFLSDGQILYGGAVDAEKLMIEPTLLDQVDWNAPVMKEEIFGPILPIMTFHQLDHVIADLQSREKPLALYYFGRKKKQQQKIIKHTSFGGGCVNDTLYHLANPHLPFGGVGNSGIGAYHGKYGFETFSHSKSILKQNNLFDIPLRYPGGKLTYSIAKRLLS
ncbi:aldehyde dehydrogenase [Ornithinibacillus gellani]|nr:aldehyde dehydrogenase [Ornithinibacillus gellani]TQS74487.1 aldehyde dehydrogenase [Ornithinibacillus gellani]